MKIPACVARYDYSILSPTGIWFKTDNPAEFCRKYRLTQSGMHRAINKPDLTYRGWKVQATPKEKS